MKRRILVCKIAPLLLVILATAFRAYHLDWQSLWDDEGFTAAILGHDLWRIAAETPYGNLPLHYYLVAAWTAASGYSEFALRFLSLWFGVLLVPLTYQLGGRLFSPSARLPAALLMAVAPSLIYQSQVARPYTLLAALYVANFLFALRLLERPGVWWLWAGLTVTAALGSYTHFFGMVLPVLAVLLFLPFARGDRRFLYGLGGAVLGILLLFTPWLLTQLSGNVGYARGYSSPSPFALASLPLRRAEQVWVGLFAQTSYDLEITTNYIWTLLPLVALCGGLALLWSHQRLSIRYAVLIYLLVPLAAGIVAGVLFTFFNPRYLLYLAPLCFALIAGIVSLPRLGSRIVAPAVIGALLLLWIPVTKDYYQNTTNEDLRSLARRITAEIRPGDAIVVNSGWRNTLLDYYLRDSGNPRRYVIPLEAPAGEKATRALLRDAMAEHERVWVVFFGASLDNSTHAIGPLLREEFARVVDRSYGTTSLGLYVKGKAGTEVGELTTFKDELTLRVGPVYWPRDGKPLDSAVFSLDWQPLKPVTRNYAGSLRLVDENGAVWSQLDSGLPNGDLKTTVNSTGNWWKEYRGLIVPAGTPPGNYTMTLTIYDVASGQALEPSGSRRLGWSRALALGQINVGVADRQPDPATLPVTARERIVFGERLALLGSKWDRSQTAGQPMVLQLFWQALKPMSRDYRLRLQLRGRSGHVAGDVTVPVSKADYPTSRWPAGSILKGQYRLPISPRSAPEEYALHLSVVDPQSGTTLATTGWVADIAGYVEVKAMARPFSAPPMSKRVDATFGPGITLLGYTIENQTQAANNSGPSSGPGRSVKVILYWVWQPGAGDSQPVIQRSYTAFVHLLDREGVLVSQHDGVPGNGQLPTTAWPSDEVIADPHSISLPNDVQKGPFTLIVGLYDSDTIQRLQTVDGADHVRLAEPSIGGL
ncbi:MAG: glycosyltransferase family 39 protein [Chloroflexi bacterium]|nr:glycosyltransferase family 39 protein [Chloroflexota bacterium]